MLKFLINSAICTLFLVLTFNYSSSAQQGKLVTLYVSSSGNDNNPGSATAPLRSIEMARNLIRKLKQTKKLNSARFTVIIKAGTYFLPEGIKFDERDSGTPGSPISYNAEEGAKVELIGAKVIPDTMVRPINTSTYKRLHPKTDPSKVFEVDLRFLKLKNASRFAPSNCFSDSWHIIDLFMNGRRQPLSQWPNPAENINNTNDPGWVTCNGSKDSRTFFFGKGGKPEDKETLNEVDLDKSRRSTRWAAAIKEGHEIWLKGFWRVPWEPFTIKVENISAEEQTIKLTEEPEGGMGSKYSSIASKDPLWRTGNGKEKWRAVNLLEEIDYPGEWALDIKDQKLYFYAPMPVANLQLMIADSDHPVISVNTASDLKFTGLHISGTRSNGIEIVTSSRTTIAGCTIYNVGNNGITMRGGNKNLIRSNTIYETGGAGIVAANSGNRKLLKSGDATIENNHIYHVGKLSFREAVQLSNCVGLTLRHNLMHDMPKSGVRTDMVNNCIFEYNEIHNIALGESDNGAFYNYGGWSTYGNIFRYNLVHHINRSNGFYCDDGDSGDLFYNNVVYDAIDAVKFGGGHNNIARNNLFIRCKDQGIDDRGIARNYRLGSHYEERLLEMKPLQEPWKSYGKKLMLDFGLGSKLWTDILNPDWHPEYPNGCALLDNISVQCGPYLRPKHGRIEISGNLELPSIKDAGFTNVEQLDFSTTNPNILEKFPNLNTILPIIGLQKDSFRKYLPTKGDTGGLENRGKAGNEWDEDQLIK
ncbi:right-handed parallel beta-helix repeat-containing protein [Desertivirga brevis]|uniref:right-handed parallel beta-helix repeat-containing protein n=1 Tax=Desertivirga brevis TaxID=2810310 RepID=UPI001A9720BE|nr:right-handed parallel beta-helix repeat-containing protein [Pedobacter sp. SYSU D00873]